jgi:hypothetical protein
MVTTAAHGEPTDATVLSFRGDQTDPATATPVDVSKPAFSQGSWTALAYGSGSFSGDDGDVYLGHVGVGYYFLDGHAINAELAFGGIDGDSGAEDSAAVAVELMVRSHWIRRDRWSLYVDAGAGIIWTENEFPAGGTDWNFTPQAGVGLTVELSESSHLMAGTRWYHISNANREGSKNNPGYNSIMVYVGVTFTF